MQYIESAFQHFSVSTFLLSLVSVAASTTAMISVAAMMVFVAQAFAA
jgi:hypothetical protein